MSHPSPCMLSDARSQLVGAYLSAAFVLMVLAAVGTPIFDFTLEMLQGCLVVSRNLMCSVFLWCGVCVSE